MNVRLAGRTYNVEPVRDNDMSEFDPHAGGYPHCHCDDCLEDAWDDRMTPTEEEAYTDHCIMALHFSWEVCSDCDGSDMSDAERDYWGERL
jgi:hypothetical protein